MLLHDRQELDDDLGARSDHDLALASLFGVVDALESIVQDGSSDHVGGVVVLRFSSREDEDLRCLQSHGMVSLQ